jgi:hypothetical protein
MRANRALRKGQTLGRRSQLLTIRKPEMAKKPSTKLLPIRTASQGVGKLWPERA